MADPGGVDGADFFQELCSSNGNGNSASKSSAKGIDGSGNGVKSNDGNESNVNENNASESNVIGSSVTESRGNANNGKRVVMDPLAIPKLLAVTSTVPSILGLLHPLAKSGTHTGATIGEAREVKPHAQVLLVPPRGILVRTCRRKTSMLLRIPRIPLLIPHRRLKWCLHQRSVCQPKRP